MTIFSAGTFEQISIGLNRPPMTPCDTPVFEHGRYLPNPKTRFSLFHFAPSRMAREFSVPAVNSGAEV